jgi:hexokinase
MKDRLVREICAAFGPVSIRDVAEAFAAELDLALRREPSSLKILPSYLSAPDGQEQGKYIAVDFGGTNIRVMAVHLLGRGSFEVASPISYPLADEKRGYDFSRESSTGQDLFDFVAALVDEVASPGETCALGLTFSYPMHQEAADKAVLLEWTKEIKTSATIGRDIKKLLTDALQRRQLDYIIPAAIINDTVAVLMAGAYSETAVFAGSICGTGHNSCYVESSLKTARGLPMVVNTEAGNFSASANNVYDKLLDNRSLDPGRQLLEKKVSGKYMGELFRLVLVELTERGLLQSSHQAETWMYQPYSIGAEVLNWLRAGTAMPESVINNWLSRHGFLPGRERELAMMRSVAEAIISRAQHLIAASFIALSRQAVRTGKQQAVAVDGSVFLKMPGFLSGIEKLISQNRQDLPKVVLLPVSNGSIVGAALAAAQAKERI